MARAGLSTESLVESALGLVDEVGADGVTLAALATRVGVATPSLYSHLKSLAELRSLLGVWAIENLCERLQRATAGRSNDDAVRAVMDEARAVALESPNRYALLPVQPAGDDRMEASAARLLGVFFRALRGYGLETSDEVHVVRRIRAAIDGFVRLEVAGGFGMSEDVDESWSQLVEAIVASVDAGARAPVAQPTA